MFCSHCGGKQTESWHAFCPHCGEKQANQTDRQSSIPEWFKWLSFLFVCFICFLTLLFIFSPDPSDPVIGQLQALRVNRITEAYYNFTAKEFKNAVTLENFRKFVQEYPFLTRQQSIKFIERNIDGEHGELKAVLSSDTEQFVMHFRLSKEEDKWKILAMSIQFKGQPPLVEGSMSGSSSIAEAFDASPIYNTIREQMEKIRSNQLAEAYQYTGKAFQAATPFSDFEQFINKHPGFKNNLKVDLRHLTFDNNIAEVKGNLISQDGKVYPIEFHLAYEAQKWKISYLHLVPQERIEADKHHGPIVLRIHQEF